MRHWLPALVVGGLLAAAPAAAGEVGIRCARTCEVSIGGRLEDGDFKVFHDYAAAQRITRVALTGPGGKVAPALAIGQEIRARGIETVVPEGRRCASACALIWLAGTRRLLAPGAAIGFHAISVTQPGQGTAETHAFDDVLVRYLAALGYTTDITATIVNTPSATIHWRDALELNANGIATEALQ